MHQRIRAQDKVHILEFKREENRCIYCNIPTKIAKTLSRQWNKKFVADRQVFKMLIYQSKTNLAENILSGKALFLTKKNSKNAAKVFRHATRNCKNQEIPRVNLERTKKGFHYTGLSIWNNIQIEIKDLPLIDQLKRNLKELYRA